MGLALLDQPGQEEVTMSKAGLIIALCVTVVSGCTLVDSAPTEVKTTENAALLAPFEPAPTISESDASSAMPAPAITRRSLTPDDIRRMQVRLRDLALDAGPVDGIAGTKTRAAVNRFQFGCGQLKDLLDGGQYSALPGDALSKAPNRRETLAMQHRLRHAGFIPGPVDGIFGAKMKTILTHLQNGCPAAQEFVAFFDQTGDTAEKRASTTIDLPERPGTRHSVPAQSRPEAAKQLATPIGVQPHEEIRVLQLRLRDAGYDPGPFDGIMGPKTKLALQQMQASQRSAKANRTLAAGIGVQY